MIRPQLDVIAVGKLFCDLVFTDLPFYPQLGQETYARGFDLSLGGSAPHVSVGLSRLGLKVALLSSLGTDYFGQWALTQLQESGVAAHLIGTRPAERTNLTVAISQGRERAFVTHLASDPALILEQPDWDALGSARLLHVAGFYGLDRQRSFFAKARSLGLTLSWDVGWMAVRDHAREIRELLPLVDIFIPNEAETLALTGAQSAEAALEDLGRLVAQPVIKLGERGSIALDRKRAQIIQQAALAVDAVDTTGAGDAFAAGFIFGYLTDQPLKTCLIYGSICGALSTTGLGGTAALPTREELLQGAARFPPTG
ncbi:MAG: carbohydrate kinase family protein [Firmicutes bacterium]|nr:carbohydrate kinase family protein [Bacillota bacterium]